jgi:hypothetical protein
MGLLKTLKNYIEEYLDDRRERRKMSRTWDVEEEKHLRTVYAQ